MSKENAQQFISALEKDGNLKSNYDRIVGQYGAEKLDAAGWEKILLEKVIPFAKENGYDFSPEDLKKLQKTDHDELSDEELGQIAGGRGTYGSYYCDVVSDDAMFEIYYTYGSLAGCSNWQGRNSDSRSCRYCVNFKHV